MISAIINQLKAQQLNGKPLFSKVEEAVNLKAAMAANISGAAAYVVEISRRPTANLRDMGNAFQPVKTTVGVVIGISKRNDLTGSKASLEVTPILEQTRKALFGFVPTPEHECLLLAAADTVGVSKYGLWKIERFTTQHTEEATNG